MRRLDHSDPSSALLFHDLIAQRLHSCPVNFRSEMMLRVKAIKEPDPVIEFVVTAHTPGERFVRVTPKVAIVAVEVRQAVSQLPERKKETDVVPVKDTESDECGNEQR